MIKFLCTKYIYHVIGRNNLSIIEEWHLMLKRKCKEYYFALFFLTKLIEIRKTYFQFYGSFSLLVAE